MPDDALLKLNDDGSVSCTVAQRRYRLRRPQMLELRRLWELWEVTSDDIDEEMDPHRDDLADLRARKSDPEASTEERREARKAFRELNSKLSVENQARWAEWVREVFAALASPDLPPSPSDDPAEGLEPWMVTGALGVDFLAHWQRAPKVRAPGAAQLLETLGQESLNP